jgi:hypothetical protein
VKKLCTNGIFDIIAQLARVTVRHDSLGRLVQDDALVDYQKIAGKLMGDDDDGDAEVTAEREDELVEFDGTDRVRPADGSSKNRRSGSSIRARAMPARFFIPPEISPGRCSAKGPRPTRSSLAGRAGALLHRVSASKWSRECQILSQCHGAEERARLKEHTERRPP